MDEVNKKRKFETDGVPHETFDMVMEKISLWEPDQLRKVLATVGSQSQMALNAITEESESDPKMRKIFVRNLPYTTTDASLRAVFEAYGPVSEAVVIQDKMKGQSKGFGFVTYETTASANACLMEPTKTVDGRQAFINLAAKKENAAAGGVGSAVGASAGGAGGSTEDITLRKLFVRSLSYDTTSQDVHEYFKQYGEVAEAVVLTNRDTGTSKGYGFVTMATTAGAQCALQETTKQLAGRTIYVKLAATDDGNSRNNQAQSSGFMAQNQFGMAAASFNPAMMGNMAAMMGGMDAGQAAQAAMMGQQAAQAYGQQAAAAAAYGQQSQQAQYNPAAVANYAQQYQQYQQQVSQQQQQQQAPY